MLCEIKISTPEWMKENDGHLEIYSHGCDAAKKVCVWRGGVARH